jgi:MscS family membrane protein
MIVLAIIATVIILKKVLSDYLASASYLMMKKSWKTVDRKEFSELFLHPLSSFIIISISIIAINKLQFPSAWGFKILKIPFDDILQKLAIGIFLFFFIRLVISIVDFIAIILAKRAKLTNDKSDDQLIVFFRDFIKVIVWLAGVLLILKSVFNQNIGNLLTGLSIVGAALALSAKESLENLIASFIIFFDKPFMVGDIVKVNQLTGVVEKIGLRSTRIRSEAKTTVTVPNKQMVDNMLDNQSLRTHRRVFSLIELATTSTHEQLNEVVTAVNFYLESRKDVESVFVFMEDFSRNAFVLHVEYFTNIIEIPAFYILRQSINLELIRIIEEKGVKMANPLGV